MIIVLLVSISGITGQDAPEYAFIGIIKLFGGNFAPQDWAFCDGALLSTNQNSA